MIIKRLNEKVKTKIKSRYLMKTINSKIILWLTNIKIIINIIFSFSDIFDFLILDSEYLLHFLI